MDALTVEHRRVELAKMVLNSSDENIINKLFSYAQKLVKEEGITPFQMTEQELNDSVDRAMEQYRNGKTISHDEFLKKHAQWL